MSRLVLPLVAVVGSMVLIPAITDAYWLSACIATVVYATSILGVGVLYGRLGIVSLCQVGLLAVGGWVTLRLGFGTDLPFPLLMLIAGLVTAFAGCLFLLPALRFNDLYIALISLMVAGALEVIFGPLGFPNGGTGFGGRVPVEQAPETLRRPGIATSDPAYFRYVVGIAALLFLFTWLHLRTRPGRAWAAIRRSEVSAASVGINVAAYKLWAIGLASFTTGVAGSLLAASIGSLDVSLFPASQSIVVFAVVLVGGAFSLWGAVIGGLLAQLLPALLTKLEISGNWTLVLFGAGLVISLLQNPTGISGQLSAASGLLRRREARST